MKDYSKLGPTPGLSLDAPELTWVTGDIDGDGRDEIVILHPRLPALVTVSWFEYADVGLPDNSTGGKGRLICTSYVSGTVAGGWMLSSTDQLFVADVDGDGTEEVVIYQSSSGYIGVLKTQGDGSLHCLWGADTLLSGMSLSPGDLQCYAVDLDGDQCDELLLFDPSATTVAVAKWDSTGNELEGLWHGKLTGGGLQIQNWDQFSPSGPVEGRPGATVVAWSAQDLYLCLLGWDGTELTVLGEPSHGQVGELSLDTSLKMVVADTSPPALTPLEFSGGGLPLITWNGTSFAWTGNGEVALPGVYTQYPTIRGVVAGDVHGDGGREVVGLYETTDGTVYLIASDVQQPTYTGSAWPTGNSPPYLAEGAIRLADLDGDGRSEVVVMSTIGHAIGVLAASGTPSLPAPATFIEVLSVTDRIIGFDRALIAGAGDTPFTSFTGNQQTLYMQISNALGVKAPDGLRDRYGSVFSVGSISVWMQSLNDQKWTFLDSYSQADIDTVVGTLLSECECLVVVDSAYDYFKQLSGYIAATYALSEGACTSAINEGPVSVSSESTLTYWTVGVLQGMVWALAAVPGLGTATSGALSLGLSAGASLFGTLTNEWVPSDGNWGTTTTGSCTAALTDLNTAISQMQPKLDIEHTAVVMDPAKLAWLASAFDNRWAYAPTKDNDPWYGASAEIAQAIVLYQLLIPALYRVAVYENTIHPYPTYRTYEKPHLVHGLNAPANSFWTVSVSEGRWNVYLLCVGDNTANIGYPPKTVTDDLFVHLKVDPEDLYGGLYGWEGIKHFDGATIMTPKPD